MRLLLLAGAGTLIELGVPGMLGIGEEFVEHAKQWDIEPELVPKLIGESLDVEHLIEALDQVCAAREALRVIGESPIAVDRADKIRAEVEWFVQHTAERVVPSDARLMWGPLLRAASSIEMTLVTTNYDRAIELAANAENVAPDDGFGLFGEREVAEWSGFQAQQARPRLIKLHGSTDWYAPRHLRRPVKLRHPMPLFGRAGLQLADGTTLGSALVLPSREKLLTHDPYPRLSQAFLNAADQCDLAVFVGSSLRDHHIRGAAETTARRVPVFIVNPKGDDFSVQNAKSIRQHASTFLISTLPRALSATDPIASLVSNSGLPKKPTSIFLPLRKALNSDATVPDRCQALEWIDDMSIALEPFFLRQLLNDPDPLVARYALGLISLSSKAAELVEEASRLNHAGHIPFSEDLAMLRQLIQP